MKRTTMTKTIMKKTMMKKRLSATLLAGSLATMSTFSLADTSGSATRIYIISPVDGATVSENVTVQFGLSGMGIAPAGIDKAGTGHHHLIIDGKEQPTPGTPMGKNVMHFGGGQTEATLQLSKGSHTLQLVLGDYQHKLHEPPVMSEKITVTVK